MNICSLISYVKNIKIIILKKFLTNLSYYNSIRLTSKGPQKMSRLLNATVISLAMALAVTTTYAEAPKEKLQMNSEYKINTDVRSNEIQGMGNKILDEASSARYLVRVDTNGTEYAYNIKRLGSKDLGYTGNPEDIAGYIFFNLTVYINGAEIQQQTTAFVPSEYSNAIKFLKMDRDEKPTYAFNLGMDSEKRLYIITSPTDVVYLNKSETIKKPISIKERNKKYVF